MEAKAEAVRLAEAERIRYASCENFEDELDPQTRNRLAKWGGAGGQGVVKAVFIRNEMFEGWCDRLYGERWRQGIVNCGVVNPRPHTESSGRGWMRDNQFDDGFSIVKSKGWCVTSDHAGVYMRRPGCSHKLNGDTHSCSSQNPCCSGNGSGKVGGNPGQEMTNSAFGRSIVRGLKCQGIIEKRTTTKPGRYLGSGRYSRSYSSESWEYVNPDDRYTIPLGFRLYANPDLLSCP